MAEKKNNATSAAPSGKPQTGEAIPQHKKLAMGQNPDVGCTYEKKCNP